MVDAVSSMLNLRVTPIEVIVLNLFIHLASWHATILLLIGAYDMGAACA